MLSSEHRHENITLNWTIIRKIKKVKCFLILILNA